MVASDAAPTATAVQLTVSSDTAITAMREKNSLGMTAMPSPRKSLICVDAISSAMPLVKPITTGRGMNFTACPSPVTARNNRIAPAIIVTISNPDSPCWAMMPATMTTNAPVGPADLDAGSAEQRRR